MTFYSAYQGVIYHVREPDRSGVYPTQPRRGLVYVKEFFRICFGTKSICFLFCFKIVPLAVKNNYGHDRAGVLLLTIQDDDILRTDIEIHFLHFQ